MGRAAEDSHLILSNPRAGINLNICTGSHSDYQRNEVTSPPRWRRWTRDQEVQVIEQNFRAGRDSFGPPERCRVIYSIAGGA